MSPQEHAQSLQTPDMTDRLRLALDIAGKDAAWLREALRAMGVPTGQKSLYKITDGTAKTTSTRMLAGMAAALGTDVRWFCEMDEDGSLNRALVAHWKPRSKAGYPLKTE